MSEWKEYKLGEVADVQTGPFGSQLHQSDYVAYGIPSIMPVNIGNRLDIITDKIVYVSEEDADRLKKYRVKEGDIVYSRRGDVEKCAYIGTKENGWLCGTGCLRIRIDMTMAHPRFVAYYLSTEEVKSWISNNAVGTTMPNLNSGILQCVDMLLPPIDEQKRIAGVLSSLDDKIDLLHRENATLEALAETLFHHYFIENPNPEWKEAKLGDVAKIGIGRTPPRKETKWFSTSSIDVKWISIKDMGEQGVFIFNTAESLTKDAVETFKIPTIPPNTVVLSFKMTVGRIGITTKKMLSNEAIAHFLLDDNTSITKEYLYLYLKSYKYDTLGSTSSIVTSINSAMIKDIEITIPDNNTMNIFDTQVMPIFEKIKSNQQQMQTLTTQRDILLPYLMSGEVKL